MFVKGELIYFFFFLDILPKSEKHRKLIVTAEVSPDLDAESVRTCIERKSL